VEKEYVDIVEHLLIALAAGGLIGFERSYHGRPAGFRTHTLVCVASSALMLVTMYQSHWYPEAFAGRVALDPTRMAQGIMTGIGFLGAGVIFKEGLNVRGLTTAASIWITAAIGILIGIGFYFPATIAAALTLGTLSAFRWIEARIPAQFYAHFYVRYARDAVVSETALRDLVKSHGFSIANLSYRLDASAGYFEYRMVIRSGESVNAAALSRTLASESRVLEFRLSPTGD
jgi:putative Mg2+ transporter-C (MgtC) family protein